MSDRQSHSVLFFKDQGSDGDGRQQQDPYSKEFTDNGFECMFAAPLSSHQVNLDRLMSMMLAFNHEEGYDALIATSQRVVDSLETAEERIRTIEVLDRVRRWKKTPVFAVGKRTGEQLNKLGYQTLGETAGRAELLAEIISSHFQPIQAVRPVKLLFLRGDKSLGTLAVKLGQQQNISFDEIVVYETGPNPNLQSGLKSLPIAPDWTVFFSPSGFDIAKPLLVEYAWWSSCRVAALGPTTAAHIGKEENGVRVDAVAQSPNAAALCVAIRDSNERIK
ncbi:hypothetical protein HDU76_001084 [Blyttiomyces sp. JEL0837]|nr:hypothetical protein HDU76_001084 [Blyttiomyces sp. JEL0837]